jgi:hypothetical protein
MRSPEDFPADILAMAGEAVKGRYAKGHREALVADVARALMERDRAATERAAKAICSGCASGVEFNEFGFHQHGTHTFHCHAEAIRSQP